MRRPVGPDQLAQFFYKHELLKPYKYYWRVECVKMFVKFYIHYSLSYTRRPDVQFFCDLDYDPFLIMQDQKKVYGQFF